MSLNDLKEPTWDSDFGHEHPNEDEDHTPLYQCVEVMEVDVSETRPGRFARNNSYRTFLQEILVANDSDIIHLIPFALSMVQESLEKVEKAIQNEENGILTESEMIEVYFLNQDLRAELVAQRLELQKEAQAEMTHSKGTVVSNPYNITTHSCSNSGPKFASANSESLLAQRRLGSTPSPITEAVIRESAENSKLPGKHIIYFTRSTVREELRRVILDEIIHEQLPVKFAFHGASDTLSKDGIREGCKGEVLKFYPKGPSLKVKIYGPDESVLYEGMTIWLKEFEKWPVTFITPEDSSSDRRES